MMQVAGELCELGPSTLLLTFLLFLTDLSIVFIKVASHLLVLRLHVLQVLLARIEIVLPTTTVVSTVEFLNNGCHLGIVGHLSLAIASLPDRVVAQTGNVTPEDSRDEDARSHLPLEHPLDLQHAPVSLDRYGRQALLLTVLFSFNEK